MQEYYNNVLRKADELEKANREIDTEAPVN